jgi:hypothetical protein
VRKYYIYIAIAILVSNTACFKQDKPYSLPPKTGSTIMQVDMGEDYDKCFFINLEQAKVVKEVSIQQWHLRFDASANGTAILLNAGSGAMRAIESGYTDMSQAINPPDINTMWGFDVSNNLVDSAYLNTWIDNTTGKSKNQVYYIRRGETANTLQYWKMQVISATQTEYVIKWDTVNGNNPKQLTIPKNASYNFVYVSLNNQGSVLPEWEPKRTEWDIVFTKYHEPFYNNNPFLYYPVTGVITNNYNTLAAADTTKLFEFASFKLSNSSQYTLTKNNNIIGYNWKVPDANYKYIVNPKLIYLVQNQLGQLYKLHFLDFYTTAGTKGAPKFEYERLL